jgi:hypothetical protein
MELGDPMEVELEAQPQRAASEAPSLEGAFSNPRQPAAGERPQAAAARLDAPEARARRCTVRPRPRARARGAAARAGWRLTSI